MAGSERRAGQQKLCTICGVDVSAVKRVKDRHGNYYCDMCWNTKINESGCSPGDVTPTALSPSSSATDLVAEPLTQLKQSWEYMWKPEMAFGGLAIAGAIGFLLPMLLFDESTGAVRILAIGWMCLGGVAGVVCGGAIPYYLARRTAAAYGIAKYFDLSVPEMWAGSTLVPGFGLLAVCVLDTKAQKELKEKGALAHGK